MERLLIAGIFLILLLGCTSQASGTQQGPSPGTSDLLRNSQSQSAGTAAAGASSSQASKTYTLADVSAHNTSGDCWVAVNGKVYDITKLVASGKHPTPYSTFCGKDVTNEYNNRPSGPGTPHPPKADNVMSKLYIGDLKG